MRGFKQYKPYNYRCQPTHISLPCPEVYHLIATWDSTGFRGTDLAVGTDAGDCHALLAHLGDVFLAFETDPEVLQRAREHSKVGGGDFLALDLEPA